MVHQWMPQETPDLLTAVEHALPPNTFQQLTAVAEMASALSMSLYLVGGTVRDALLGAPVKDLDIVVEGDASLLASEVSRSGGGDISVYSQFGTATVKLKKQRFDLTTARRETYIRPGALPRVTPSTIQEDLGRRDFSINAMATALSGPATGELLDPHGGKEDLNLGLIRMLHSQSFVDDATRILRAVRYERRLNFRLEEDTQRSLLDAIEGRMLDTVSGDRIRAELALIFGEPHPEAVLSRCAELGILQAIHLRLGDGQGVKALASHAYEKDALACLAALSYPLSVQEGEAFVDRLRMPSRWAQTVRDTIALRLKWDDPSAGPRIGGPRLPSAQLCALLDQFSLASVQINALLAESPQIKSAIDLYLNRWRHVRPSLSGKDIIALGADQGPLVGEVLRELKNARIEGKIATRQEEVDLAKEYIARKGG